MNHKSTALPPACIGMRSFLKEHPLRCYFLLEFIPDEAIDGLEQSSFARAVLFQEYFGTDTTLLTTLYRPRHSLSLKLQFELGRLPASGVTHLNLYDFVQDIDRSVAPQRIEPITLVPEGCHAETVPDKADLKVLGPDGNLVQYIGTDNEGRVEFVNYLSRGQVVRRDTYDPWGFLSRTAIFELGKGLPRCAYFYRPDHSLAATEVYKLVGPDSKKYTPVTIELSDRLGAVTQRFTSLGGLAAHWLLNLLSDRSVNHLLIADKTMFYREAYAALYAQRDLYSHVRSVVVIHSVHVANAAYLMESPLLPSFSFIAAHHERVDALVTLSEWQRRDIEKRFPVPGRRVFCIPHHTWQTRSDLPAPALNLPEHSMIMVGRIDKNKQQEHAIRVLKRVIKRVPDATLHIFGSGEKEGDCRALVAELGLNDKVVFHGFIPDLSAAYRKASLMLLCSKVEGFPLVVKEALTHGCPVIAYHTPYGASALVIHEQNGFLIPPFDQKMMAQRCVAVLTKPTLRQRLSEDAKKSVERFAPHTVASLWAGLILNLFKIAPAHTVQED